MTFLLYLAQVSIYAAIMWGIYAIVWRNRPLHAYSRVYLLLSLVLTPLLPLIRLPGGRPATASVKAAGIALTQVSPAGTTPVQMTQEAIWPSLIMLIYFSVSLALATVYAAMYIRLHRKLRTGSATRSGAYTLITHTGIGPGTFGRRIFFPGSVVHPAILVHEQAHIQSGHRYDSLLLQIAHIIFWISPAHWLIGRELKTVHEFEADRLAAESVDERTYASLLLSQSLDAPYPFAISHSFFHHPLKRRIMMLQKTQAPKKGMLLAAGLALTVGFTTTVLLANPRKAIKPESAPRTDSTAVVIDMDVVRRNTPPRQGEIKTLEDGTIAFTTVGQMPSFNGSLQDWLLANLSVPEPAGPEKATNGCLIQFLVAGSGAISRPQIVRPSGDQNLDKEALRVVGMMPAWKPGIQQGQPVPVLYTLTIFYKGAGGC